MNNTPPKKKHQKYYQKDNMSQLGGMKILLELLKKGQYRGRLSEILDGYKSRSILQLMIGLWWGYLQRFLPLFEKRWKTVFRADSGYYNESAFKFFSENDCTFFVKAPMSESRQNFVQLSNSLVWITEANGLAYASYITNTTKGTKFREIYKRTPIDSGKQLLLGEIASYRYDCLATNDLSVDENAAFEIYNKRANIENAIKELKEDYHLGKIVTDDFNANVLYVGSTTKKRSSSAKAGTRQTLNSKNSSF